MDMSGKLHVLAALPQGNSPGTHWTEYRVRPRAGPDALVKTKKKSLPLPGIEPRSSNPQPSHHTDNNYLSQLI